MTTKARPNVDARQATNDLTDLIAWARKLRTMLGAVADCEDADLYEATETIASLSDSLWDSLDLRDAR